MPQPRASAGPPDPDRAPSWAGAPGFTPYQDGVMPHAPMPGAPPYPAAGAPPPVARPGRGPGIGRTLLAAGVWAAASFVLILVMGGIPGPVELGLFVLSLVLPTLLAAVAVWLAGVGRHLPFWLLLLIAAPFFWVLRGLQNYMTFG